MGVIIKKILLFVLLLMTISNAKRINEFDDSNTITGNEYLLIDQLVPNGVNSPTYQTSRVSVNGIINDMDIVKDGDTVDSLTITDLTVTETTMLV